MSTIQKNYIYVRAHAIRGAFVGEPNLKIMILFPAKRAVRIKNMNWILLAEYHIVMDMYPPGDHPLPFTPFSEYLPYEVGPIVKGP